MKNKLLLVKLVIESNGQYQSMAHKGALKTDRTHVYALAMLIRQFQIYWMTITSLMLVMDLLFFLHIFPRVSLAPRVNFLLALRTDTRPGSRQKGTSSKKKHTSLGCLRMRVHTVARSRLRLLSG